MPRSIFFSWLLILFTACFDSDRPIRVGHQGKPGAEANPHTSSDTAKDPNITPDPSDTGASKENTSNETLGEDMPPPPEAKLTGAQMLLAGALFRHAGAAPGMHCLAITELDDKTSWDDNYFCTRTDFGIKWSSAGPLAGMVCTNIVDPEDTHTKSWQDNFLCHPENLGISFSAKGQLPGKECVGFGEPSDAAWADNWLCWPKAADPIARVVVEPSCKTPGPLLRGGDFESGVGPLPPGWTVAQSKPNASTVSWVAGAGVNGSRGIRISTPDGIYNDVVLRIPFNWNLYTAYLVKAKIKLSNFTRTPGRSYGATVGVTEFIRELGPTQMGNTDWTEYTMDFATGPGHRVDLILEYHGTGTAEFDDVGVECNSKVTRFAGEKFILNLYQDNVASIGGEAVAKRTVANISKLVEGYEEFTGVTSPEPQSAWAPKNWPINASGWSGNALLWSGEDGNGENWRSIANYVPHIFIHELCHNHDSLERGFNDHMDALPLMYTVDKHSIVDNAEKEAPLDVWFRKRKEGHEKYWGQRQCPYETRYYRELQFQKEVGWEPFKKAYHALLEPLAPPAIKPTEPWLKLNRYYDQLTRFAGRDPRTFYGEGELEAMERWLTPETAPTLLPFQVPMSVTQMPVAKLKWDSASVGSGNIQLNRDNDGNCLIATKTRSWPTSIFARAPSRLVYPLRGAWANLKVGIGLLSGAGSAASVYFIVKADGVEIYRSGLVRSASPDEFINVSLVGRQNLELIVLDGGDGSSADLSVWLDPQLSR